MNSQDNSTYNKEQLKTIQTLARESHVPYHFAENRRTYVALT